MHAKKKTSSAVLILANTNKSFQDVMSNTK